jgi:hypothetical protein
VDDLPDEILVDVLAKTGPYLGIAAQCCRRWRGVAAYISPLFRRLDPYWVWAALPLAQWALARRGRGALSRSQRVAALRAACEHGDCAVVQWLYKRFGVAWCAQFAATHCAAAAQHGHLALLQWLARTASAHNVPWWESSGICAAAAAHGDVWVLLWLRNCGCRWDEKATEAAAAHGRLAALQWMRSLGTFCNCPISPQSALAAAGDGHVEVLRWILCTPSTPLFNDRDRLWRDCAIRAAERGRSALLGWLFDLLCTPDTAALFADVINNLTTGLHSYYIKRDLMAAALAGGWWDCVRCLGVRLGLAPRPADPPPPSCVATLRLGGIDICAAAVKRGSLPLLQWGLQAGCVVRVVNALNVAAKHGHLDVLRWLVEEQPPEIIAIRERQIGLLLRAAKGGHLDALRWMTARFAIDLREKNIGVDICDLAASNRHAHVVRWALVSGVDWDPIKWRPRVCRRRRTPRHSPRDMEREKNKGASLSP